MGELACSGDARYLSLDTGGRSGDVITTKSQRFTQGDLLGSGEVYGRPENERTMVDGPAEVRGSRTTGRRV